MLQPLSLYADVHHTTCGRHSAV